MCTTLFCTVFVFVDRVITGDTLFGVVSWACVILASWLSWRAKRWPVWVQWIYAVFLSFGLMVLAHFAVDALQVWWIRPIDEPMFLRR